MLLSIYLVRYRFQNENLSQVIEQDTLVGEDKLKVSVVGSNLHIPWEITWGYDERIWFTQRNGYIKRLDPVTGDVHTLYCINDSYQWTSSGTLGMAMHPEFEDTPYMYVAYTFKGKNSEILERILRLTYDNVNDTLVNPTVLVDSITTGTGNYGTRIIIAENKLLVSLGQGTTFERPWTEDVNSDYAGIIIRLNLDGSIPQDNPYPSSPIFATGFRNPQGLTLGPNQHIYCSDHGPSYGDELNLVTAGSNYGWPLVSGFCDNFPLKTENESCLKTKAIEPLREWTPTIAPCGIEYYNSDLIEAWQNSILLVTLKESDLRVLKLSSNGLNVVSEFVYLDNAYGRLRDLCVSPDGRIFISTSNTDHNMGDDYPDGGNNFILCIEPEFSD